MWHITLDTLFQPVDTIVTPVPHVGDIHERLILANGNSTIIGITDSIMDLSGYTFDGLPGGIATKLASTNIIEVDSNDSIVFEWIGSDHVHPTEYIDGISNYDSAYFDYLHANAIDVDFDGHYLLSQRSTSSILKINRQTGAIIWRLGGSLSDFTFPNDGGFSAQHSIKS